jgi:peptide deformylase
MPVIPTVQIGEPVIRKRAVRVETPRTSKNQKVVRDLIDSMRADNLVGMAAPQIGESVRIFVSEVRTTTYRKNIGPLDGVRVFINPRIIERSTKNVAGYEGCGLFGKVARAAWVRVRAQDEQGKPFELKAVGLLARIIQHEIDHLDGRVFLDRMKDMRSLMGREEYINAQSH